MDQKHEKFREFRTPFPPRDIRKNPRSMYARVPQVMAQFVLKIELLSHIMGTTSILEMARAYALRPRLWLLGKTKFLHGEQGRKSDIYKGSRENARLAIGKETFYMAGLWKKQITVEN